MPVKKKKASKKKVVKKKAVKRKAVKRAAPKRKPSKKPARLKKKAIVKKPKESKDVIGTVTHYFPHVRAAVIKLKSPLGIGESIKIKGHTTDLTQNITSMQIDRVPIEKAKKGDEIGLLVNSRVRQHDSVYRVK
jgi:hypothetical protein